MAVPDPLLSSTVLRTGLRKPLKPPFNLRDRGAPTFGCPQRRVKIAPRGPPLCDVPDAGAGDFDLHAQPALEYAFDQRIAW